MVFRNVLVIDSSYHFLLVHQLSYCNDQHPAGLPHHLTNPLHTHIYTIFVRTNKTKRCLQFKQ